MLPYHSVEKLSKRTSFKNNNWIHLTIDSLYTDTYTITFFIQNISALPLHTSTLRQPQMHLKK